MKTKIILAVLTWLSFVKVSGQDIVTDLYGFRLGQFRETATNEFGNPFVKDKYEDGFEYEAYLLKPDTSLYMFFEFAAGQTDVIWSIQISGYDTTTDIQFKNLKFGMDKAEIEKLFGKPTNKENIGDYGERWDFENTNYSFEINTKGRLSSIKIKDTYSADTLDMSKIPSFETVLKALSAKSNSEISEILAPGIEIYYQDKIFFFSKSLQTEIKNDYSKVFETIRTLSRGLEKVNTRDQDAYEENFRVTTGKNPTHVIKIKGHIIREIVLQYLNGTYLIWEIRT